MVADLNVLLVRPSSVIVGGGLGDQIVRSRFSVLLDGLPRRGGAGDREAADEVFKAITGRISQREGIEGGEREERERERERARGSTRGRVRRGCVHWVPVTMPPENPEEGGASTKRVGKSARERA